jgi:predicted nuclease of restriction endonuclease-like (RecB) superfamily
VKPKPVRRRKGVGAGRQIVAVPASRRGDTYAGLVGDIAGLLESARRTAARAVNAVMTAVYWEVGRRIVEFEQGGKARAEYGEALLKQLAADLTARFGRGFGMVNLSQMKKLYLLWPPHQIFQTPSEQSHLAPTGESDGRPALAHIAARFPLPWSAYVRLLAVRNGSARRFYETEALRGGWSVRQLDRQIESQYYERTALSRSKVALLSKGARARPEDAVSPEEEVKDPYVLEFLGLRDEYSETDLEEALIRHLQSFLLELGGDFCFAGRQKRLRIGDEWFRVDLVFYHRRLRCLVLIDLKLGRFTHADAGQMHTYLNYAAEHWMHPGENPPVGLILCAERNDSLARYALGNLPNKVLASEYRTVLPDEKLLAADLEQTRRMLERRGIGRGRK